ncbi:MAG: HAMP domain-containing histidine kinase [Lachnospiraceae bacterium]|nr:HAMP domain-containing histidine kinase [Lachnospiraceae bacterium]
MLWKNKEFRQGLLLIAAVSLILTAAGFFHSVPTGLFVLAAGIAVCLIYSFTERYRYKKLEELCTRLAALLRDGTSLPIRNYEEGELSLLANEIQKVTLLLKERAETIQEKQVFLSDALADISHQLRTPLTTMNLTIGLLQEKGLPESRRNELVRELNALLLRTEWLVEALLKLSRLDANAITMAKEECPVETLIDRAADPLLIAMELKEISLYRDTGNARFTGDLNWTAEAVENILRNCMDYTLPGGNIRIRAEENALFTALTVTDSGPGIAPEDLPHLFERFYKGRGSSENGYGIGLALAKQIILSEGGTLRAFNTPGGACFEIKFYKQVL